MVFPKIHYRHRRGLRRASGVAVDLVAPANDTGMEDRTHHSHLGTQLDVVPGHDRIHSHFQGLLQAIGRAVTVLSSRTLQHKGTLSAY